MIEVKYEVIAETPVVTASTGIIGKEIDVIMRKDVNGRAYFPGKHIKGILKSKVFQFKNALEENEKNKKINQNEVEKFIEKYFGRLNNNPSKFRFSNLIIKNEFNRNIKGYRYGIKINRKMKVTEDKSLFSFEFMNPGTVYEGSIEINDYIKKEDLHFIFACLLHVDKIGGLKSRGIGRIKIIIKFEEKKYDFHNLGKFIEILCKRFEITSNKKVIGYKECDYILKFKEPIVLQRELNGNTIKIRRSLQGTTIRGAIIQYGLNNGFDINELLNISLGEVIKYNGEKPEIKLASTFKTKYPTQTGNIEKTDKTIYVKNDSKEKIILERDSVAQFSPVGNEISIEVDRKTKSVKEEMFFNTEYAASKEEGKKEEEVSFRGNIKIPENFFKAQEDEEIELLIGKFKTKGFGKVTIKFSENKKGEKNSTITERIEVFNKKVRDNISENEKDPEYKRYLEENYEEFKESGSKELITFDFLSDMILPFNQVQNVGEEIINLILKDEDIEKLKLNPKRTFINLEKLKGYNIINDKRKCDEIVIAEGSVITYLINKKDRKDLVQELEKIEKEGIGLRRNEGFGRIRICSDRKLGGEDNVCSKENS